MITTILVSAAAGLAAWLFTRTRVRLVGDVPNPTGWDGRTLPWRIAGRVVKPYAFAVAFSTAVVSTAVVQGVAVGALLDTWPGHVVGIVGWASVVMLWYGWWSQSKNWMQRGLLTTVFVWGSVWGILLWEQAWVSAWLACAWAMASAGAWTLEALDRERR